MPIKLQIKTGPSFKKLLSYASLLADTAWTLTFRFVHPTRGEVEKAIGIEVLGRPLGRFCTEDDYCFIGFSNTKIWSTEFDQLYLVGQYNIRSRTGSCEVMTLNEFFASPVACLLFTDEARVFHKHSLSKAVGFNLIKVAVFCSKTHEGSFLEVISQTNEAIRTDISEADIIVTDCREPNVEALAQNSAHWAFYAAKPLSPRITDTCLNYDIDKACSELQALIKKLSLMPTRK